MGYAYRCQTTSCSLSNDAHLWSTITLSSWLTLDPMFLSMPKDQGEFIIMQELVHLLAPKHGKLFKLLMHAYLPDWEGQEQRL